MDLLYDRVLEVLIAALFRFFCFLKLKKEFSSFPDVDTGVRCHPRVGCTAPPLGRNTKKIEIISTVQRGQREEEDKRSKRNKTYDLGKAHRHLGGEGADVRQQERG